MQNSKLRLIVLTASISLSFVCIMLYYWFLLKASAIGDAKAGLGNAIGAIQIEDAGFPFLLTGSVLFGCFIGFLIKRPIWLRIFLAIMSVFAIFVVIFFMGFNFHPLSIHY